jgi:hypothetical protein
MHRVWLELEEDVYHRRGGSFDCGLCRIKSNIHGRYQLVTCVLMREISLMSP